MKTKAIIPLILGLGIGIVAIKMFVDKLQSARASHKTEATVDVVTATTHINSTLEITESMLDVQPWPKHLVPEHTFQKVEEVAGRVTSGPIAKGGFVSATLLAPRGTPAGLSSRLPEGYRALAIKVDEVASVGGWIQPGSKVDVICVIRPSTRGASQQSRLLLQNVEVLTVGDKIESKESGAQISRSVTLMLTPKQVAKVNLASTKGKLSLAMRNPEDETEPQDAVVTDADLFENDKDSGATQEQIIESAMKRLNFFSGHDQRDAGPPVQTVAALPQEKPWTVEVISGTNIYEVQFESDEHNARRMTSDPRSSQRRPSQIGKDSGQRRPDVQNRPLPGDTDASKSALTPENPDNTQEIVEPSPDQDEWPSE